MRILLELLDDANQLLSALDDVDELRPETRKRLKAALEELCEQSARLLRGEPGPTRAAGEGEVTSRGHNGAEALDAQEREWLLGKALEAIAAEDLGRAESLLEQGIAQFDDEEFHNHLGLVSWERGDIARAAECYSRAMDAGFPKVSGGAIDWSDYRHRGFLRAMEGRALSLYRLDRVSEAVELFDALANTNAPGFMGCRYLAGEARHRLGELSEAIANYRLGPDEPATHYNLGLALFESGRREEAARSFITALEANPYIALRLLCRTEVPMPSSEGYLGSREYATSFLEDCAKLWEGTDDALAFLEACLDHPLVLDYLSHEPAEATMSWGRELGAQSSEIDEMPSVDEIARVLTARKS